MILDNLRTWLLKRFGSINKAAEALGMNQSQLSRYLAGGRKPGQDFFLKLLEYDCDINWLLTGQTTIEKKNKKILELEARVKVLEHENSVLYKSLNELKEAFDKAIKLTK